MGGWGEVKCKGGKGTPGTASSLEKRVGGPQSKNAVFVGGEQNIKN